MAKPDKIYIPYEDTEYARFDCVGKLPDGTQFMAFVTSAFPGDELYYSGSDALEKKKWLAVVHRFDTDGNHLGSESRIGGNSVEHDAAIEKASAHLDELLQSLSTDGRPEMCGIWVRLFSVVLDGITHGLIYEQSEEDSEPDEETDDWVVLVPEDIMFQEPYDDGEYST